MWNRFVRVVTVGALALSTVAPAFAACNPGTPHCVTDGGPGSRLAKAKDQIFTPGTFGNCDPVTTLCSDDIAGSSRKVGPGTTTNPVTSTNGKVMVAPPIQ
jgi:hypothetical protein